jgi:CHRD domain
MRKVLVVLAVCAVAVPAVALAGGSAKLEAKLSGAKETPKGAPAGRGSADVVVTGTKVCWEFKYSGIGKPTAAHIHKGKPGTAGPVVVPFGAAFKRQGCTTAPAAVSGAIVRNPAGYYVNIHTAKFPGGAIRGQLEKES